MSYLSSKVLNGNLLTHSVNRNNFLIWTPSKKSFQIPSLNSITWNLEGKGKMSPVKGTSEIIILKLFFFFFHILYCFSFGRNPKGSQKSLFCSSKLFLSLSFEHPLGKSGVIDFKFYNTFQSDGFHHSQTKIRRVQWKQQILIASWFSLPFHY